jgi:hypothetical protein
MRIFVFATVLTVASVCGPQQLSTNPQQVGNPEQSQVPARQPQVSHAATAQNQTVTIPAGTRIPLRLVSQITRKARPGDTIRATTAFPVTVGTQMAIPVGSYVEGAIVKLKKRSRSVQLRLTRIVYANGYTVPIYGTNVEGQPPGNTLTPRLPQRKISTVTIEG